MLPLLLRFLHKRINLRKRVLVTGGGSGLGKAFVSSLFENGYAPVVHYHQTPPDSDFESYQADFTSLDEIRLFAQRVLKAPLWGVVHNAALYLQEESWEEATAQMQVNFLAPMELNRLFETALLNSRGACLMVGSIGLGRSRPVSWSLSYTASKEALWSYTRSLAKKWAPSVRVNMLSPGMLESSKDFQQFPHIPTVSLNTLCSEFLRLLESSVTAQNIEVSGNWIL